MNETLILKPDVVRRALLERSATAPDNYSISEKGRGALIGHINSALDTGVALNRDTKRRIMLGWLFCPDDLSPEPLSTKDMSDNDFFALSRWIGSVKVGGEWVTRTSFPAEARWAFNWALYDSERLHLFPHLHMVALLNFWETHTYDINEADGEIARSALWLGGIPTSDPDTHATLDAVGMLPANGDPVEVSELVQGWDDGLNLVEEESSEEDLPPL